MANKKKQLTAQLNALKERTAGYQTTFDKNLAEITAAKMDAETPYVEEFPAGFEADIPGIMQNVGTSNLVPGTLKAGFTSGPLPTEYQGMLGNPDILGWRIVTDANKSQRIEVQTDANNTVTYGAIVGGYKPSTGGGGSAGSTPTGLKTAEQLAKEATDAANKAARQSAYDLLYAEFKKYGLESLVEGVKDLVQQSVSPSEFAIALQNTKAYQQRFAANQDRIKAGLRALTPAEYIGLEDQYQNIMRNYGLPPSYWSKDSMGTQAGFNKFIAGDVSAAELEDRIATAQKRVINADVNTKDALRKFYPDITDADILAYTLDPTNALENIKRKVTAAEIGGAAMAQGFNKGTTPEEIAAYAARANELAGYGITKAQAQQGYQTIGEVLPAGQKLADIYEKQGLGPYSQLLAEQEVFGTQGAVDAARKRRKLAELEKSTFMGTSGVAQGALARDRAGGY